MIARNNRTLVIGSLLGLCIHHVVFAQPSASSAWRRSDAALVQVCFDKLDSEPPKTLPVTVVSENTLASQTLELVGYTLTRRPVYQGNLFHPSSFQSALIALPNRQVVVKVDRPENFDTYIDVWKYVPANVCFSDKSFAFKMLGNGRPSADVACPDLGINLLLTVTAGSENALVIRDARERGPKEFNGFRGCREPAYLQRKRN